MEALYSLFRRSAGVNTDTRTLQPGQLFFALKGENFDGNVFALKALEAGALTAVVEESFPGEDPRLIKVPDTLECLKALAARHRLQVKGGERLPVLALTGTNGKTTTKELISAALSARFQVTATKGNLNNEIGVPLSVLQITPETEIAVIEMGASHPEDLKPLLAVAQPDFGLITNVGKAHLEGFGSFEGVQHAKGLLYEYLAAHDGLAFVRADDFLLRRMAAERGVREETYQVPPVLPASQEAPFVRMEVGGEVLETHLVGAYNAANVAAALAIAGHFGVPEKAAAAAIAAYVPTNNRSQLSRTASNLVIEDAYNANPSSMAVALDNLAGMAGRKVALLGDMRELGADSHAEHCAVLRRLDACGLEAAFLVGPCFAAALQEEQRSFIQSFPDSDALAAYLSAHPLEGCTVLVKGSRGIRMEKVLPAL